jgi:hypothetical protein
MAGAYTTYASQFALGQKVCIGEDDQTVATVTGILWKAEAPQFEVSWMNNGALQCVWVSPTILKPAKR